VHIYNNSGYTYNQSLHTLRYTVEEVLGRTSFYFDTFGYRSIMGLYIYAGERVDIESITDQVKLVCKIPSPDIG
jgi:hypothetical protein